MTWSAGKQGGWVKVAILTACYSLCSSMLLILNKVAVTYIPAPSFILACQLGSTALFVKGMAVAGAVEAEPLCWAKSKKFALIVFGFIGTLFASVTSLKVKAYPCAIGLVSMKISLLSYKKIPATDISSLYHVSSTIAYHYLTPDEARCASPSERCLFCSMYRSIPWSASELRVPWLLRSLNTSTSIESFLQHGVGFLFSVTSDRPIYQIVFFTTIFLVSDISWVWGSIQTQFLSVVLT